jgi:hypothetical protein
MMQTTSLPPNSSKPGWLAIVGLPLGLAAIMTPAVLLAAGAVDYGEGFDSIVHGIEHRYHAHATRIPFMGVISGIAGIATHGGVHNLHIAEFEHFKGDGDKQVDGAELLALVESHSGGGWSRMIRETSRQGDEQTLIYIRPEGRHVGMLVVDLDHNELDLVQLSMNPDQLMKEAREHTHHHHDSDSDDGDKNDSAHEGDSN